MTIGKFDSMYNHHVRCAIRRLYDYNLRFFKCTRDDWIDCLLELDKLEGELFKNYSDENSGVFNITSEEWSELCHKHMNINKVTKEFFFEFWQDGRDVFSDYDEITTLHFEDATKEEIEFAREHFSHVIEDRDDIYHEHNHTFSDDAKVLTYRGHRFIVDNEWQDAWAIKNNKVISFRLIWDWWFPIDEYLDY